MKATCQQCKDLNEIYGEGVRAYGQGKYPEDCPYHLGTQEEEAWLDGYIDADAQESGDFD